MNLRRTLLASLLLLSTRLFSQHASPDRIFGRPMLPVWNRIEVQGGFEFVERTYFLWPADSTTIKPEERLFRGIGRAYYDKLGNLLWVEEGYGAQKRICATEREVLSGPGGMEIMDEIQKQKGTRLVSLISNGNPTHVQLEFPAGDKFRIDWIDRGMAEIRTNPCR